MLRRSFKGALALTQNGLTLHRADGEAGRPVEALVRRRPLDGLRGMSILDDFCFESVSKAVLFHFQIVSGLKIQPKSLTCTEEPGKSQGSIRGYVPLPMNNFVDAPSGNADTFGQPILADSHWAQELL
jgi:hypothetical protein